MCCTPAPAPVTDSPEIIGRGGCTPQHTAYYPQMATDMAVDELVAKRVQAGITQAEVGAELARMAGNLTPIAQTQISLAETGTAPLPRRHTWAQYDEAVENIKQRRASGDEGRVA